MKNSKRLHWLMPKSAFQGHRLPIFMGFALVTGLTAAPAAPVVVSSPNGSLKAEVSTEGGVLQYSISLDGQQVLAPSEVGIQSDGIAFGKEATVGMPTIRKVDESYAFLGAKSKAVNRARVATMPVTTNGQQYSLDLHVADDGVGIRLRLPAKPGRRVEADLSTWRLPGNPVVWATTYDPGYERTYQTSTLQELGTKSYGLPLTAKVGDKYVTLSEAALKDYGDLGIKGRGDGALAGYLPNDARGWTTDSEVVQPWRVTIVARDLTALVNTTLVQNLNPPPDASLLNADWILAGRSAWQWMAIGAPRIEDQHQWVDWTKELGYEYYLVDEGWSSWADAWAALKSVCDYAKTQNVKVWLWVDSKEVQQPAARKAYFQRAVETGIVGVKVDFPQPTNRWGSNWYQDTARDAAAAKLLIDFHGATKPTGMERTWPNELTREGVRGHEWHMTRYGRRLEPQHDTILPFTRYVVGHGDYTPIVFEAKELQGNTWAHEMAQAIIFTSPFLCMGGHPRDYVTNPAKDVISALPAAWDETIVLPGSEPGKIAGMARRHGAHWFIGVMNDADNTVFDISLDFLGHGAWKATRLGDVQSQADAWDRKEEAVNAHTSWHVPLSSRGGFVAWIRK
jgi:alpha-glucosidase